MRFTAHLLPELKSLDNQFYCRGKRSLVKLVDCLDGYVDATSLEKRRSACFHCPHGRINRQAYASPCEEAGA